MSNIDPKQARAEARVEAASAKARAKAMRPWYKKKRFIIPLVLILLIVIISVASGGGEDDKDSSSDSGSSATSTDDGGGDGGGEQTYKIGETSKTGDFEVVVHAVEDPLQTTNEFDTASEGQRLVGVEVEMKNVGDERITMSTLLGAELIDSQNRPWDITIAGIDRPQVEGEVMPGQSRRGWMVFGVGEDATGLKMRLKGNLTAGGVLYELQP